MAARDAQIDEDLLLARRLQQEELMGAEPADADGVIREQTNDIASSIRASPRCVAIVIACSVIEVIAGIVVLVLSPVSSTCSYNVALSTGLIVFLARHVVTIPHEHFRCAAQRHENQQAMRMSARFDTIRLYTFLSFAGVAFLFLTDASYTNGSGCSAVPDGTSSQHLRIFFIVLLSVHLTITFSSVVILAMICLCFPCLLFLMRFVKPQHAGLDKESVKKLPERVFKVEDDHGQHASNPPTCVICQTDYADGDQLKHLNCNHEFHSSCLDQWLELKASCPLCREVVGRPDRPSADVVNIPMDAEHVAT
ncbi:RING-type domain-containing protein [Plasmodiophora brassicae]